MTNVLSQTSVVFTDQLDLYWDYVLIWSSEDELLPWIFVCVFFRYPPKIKNKQLRLTGGFKLFLGVSGGVNYCLSLYVSLWWTADVSRCQLPETLHRKVSKKDMDGWMDFSESFLLELFRTFSISGWILFSPATLVHSVSGLAFPESSDSVSSKVDLVTESRRYIVPSNVQQGPQSGFVFPYLIQAQLGTESTFLALDLVRLALLANTFSATWWWSLDSRVGLSW